MRLQQELILQPLHLLETFGMMPPLALVDISELSALGATIAPISKSSSARVEFWLRGITHKNPHLHYLSLGAQISILRLLNASGTGERYHIASLTLESGDARRIQALFAGLEGMHLVLLSSLTCKEMRSELGQQGQGCRKLW